MKFALTLLVLSSTALVVLILSGCAFLHLPPIKAKVCYHTSNGEVCAGTDGKSIIIEGEITKNPAR